MIFAFSGAEDGDVPLEVIKSLLKKSNNISGQAYDFVNGITLDEDDDRKRERLLQDLQETFQRCCQTNQIFVSPFGSSMTTLGLKGCDLDVFINLGKEYKKSLISY